MQGLGQTRKEERRSQQGMWRPVVCKQEGIGGGTKVTGGACYVADAGAT